MDPIDVAQRVLRILFYVFVVAALALYAAERWMDYPNTFWIWCGLGAIGCSLVRFFIRFI